MNADTDELRELARELRELARCYCLAAFELARALVLVVKRREDSWMPGTLALAVADYSDAVDSLYQVRNLVPPTASIAVRAMLIAEEAAIQAAEECSRAEEDGAPVLADLDDLLADYRRARDAFGAGARRIADQLSPPRPVSDGD